MKVAVGRRVRVKKLWRDAAHPKSREGIVLRLRTDQPWHLHEYPGADVEWDDGIVERDIQIDQLKVLG